LSDKKIIPSSIWSIHHPDQQVAYSQILRRDKLPPPQDWVCPLLPAGYVFKFRLISSHGDEHYIGLNGIQLFDARHQPITLRSDQIKAIPDSIQVEIPSCKGDLRKKENLITAPHNTWDDRFMFLSPYSPKNLTKPNEILIIFDQPVCISCIQIWNYSKTPKRGVKELEVYADDKLFFKTWLKAAPGAGRQSLDFCQSALFTNDRHFIQKEFEHVVSWLTQPQEVGLWNETICMDRHRKVAVGPARSFGSERPKTMMTRQY